MPFQTKIYNGKAIIHYVPDPMFHLPSARKWNARFLAAQQANQKAPLADSETLFNTLVLQESTAETGRQGKVPVERIEAARATWRSKTTPRASDLKAAHRLLSGSPAATAFRTTPVWVGAMDAAHATMVAPPAELVQRLVDRAVAILSDTSLCPLLSTLLFFTRILHVHPYLDGNGRLARFVLLCRFQSHGISLEFAANLLRGIAQGRGHAWLFENYTLSRTEEWEPFLEYLLHMATTEDR